jgi:hypothetical protein
MQKYCFSETLYLCHVQRRPILCDIVTLGKLHRHRSCSTGDTKYMSDVDVYLIGLNTDIGYPNYFRMFEVTLSTLRIATELCLFVLC